MFTTWYLSFAEQIRGLRTSYVAALREFDQPSNEQPNLGVIRTIANRAKEDFKRLRKLWIAETGVEFPNKWDIERHLKFADVNDFHNLLTIDLVPAEDVVMAGLREELKQLAGTEGYYVSPARIAELEGLKANGKFDLSRLISTCNELNAVYRAGALLAIPMLVRSILDHIPPIYGFQKFVEVASNHPGRSFKDNAKHLDESTRKIADSYLHTPIRKVESLPTPTQVDAKASLDFVLGETVRLLKLI